MKPGDGFIDCGALEECVPTVRGVPDHGAAWSRVWSRDGDTDLVDCGDFTLRRRIAYGAGGVSARYRLTADPGYRFLWAAHALLDVSPTAGIDLPDGTPVRIFPEGAPVVTGTWPEPCGLPLHRLGPDDGTAIGAIAVGVSGVAVTDGPERLRMDLRTPRGVPTGIALWRNLNGWPQPHPYRSIGVEPMLGSAFDLAAAGPDDAAVVPGSGYLDWELQITAA